MASGLDVEVSSVVLFVGRKKPLVFSGEVPIIRLIWLLLCLASLIAREIGVADNIVVLACLRQSNCINSTEIDVVCNICARGMRTYGDQEQVSLIESAICSL